MYFLLANSGIITKMMHTLPGTKVGAECLFLLPGPSYDGSLTKRAVLSCFLVAVVLAVANDLVLNSVGCADYYGHYGSRSSTENDNS